MKRFLTFEYQNLSRFLVCSLALLLVPFCVNAQTGDCEVLFLSEYIDGSGDDKALEIFNPTADEVDLKDYSIGIYFDGYDVPTMIELTGVVAAKDVYVLAYSGASARIMAQIDQASEVYHPDGNDAIGLFQGSTLIDLIGEAGVNPGSEGWAVANDAGYPFLNGSTDKHTLVRIPYALQPNPSWSVTEHEWVALPIDTLGFLGFHLSPCRNSDVYSIEFTAITMGDWLYDRDEDYCISYQCIHLGVELDHAINTPGDQVIATVVASNSCTNPTADIGSTLDYQLYDAFGTPSTSPMATLDYYFNTQYYDFWLKINDDLITEPDEYICIDLQASGASLGSNNYVSTRILDNDMVGLGDIGQMNKFQFHPNPTADKLVMNNFRGIGDVVIVNQIGQVFVPHILSQDGEKTIDVEGLPSGLYYLRFSYKSEFMAYKFVKE
jgi:hypothetical protein